MTESRIGNGFDVHPLRAGRKLFLGGVEIPFEKGLAGHSDADALIHSICDAILGALSLGDIGKFFPDTDMQYKDARSTIFLDKIYGILEKEGARILNIDATVIAERPKISPHSEKMRAVIAKHLKIEKSSINIKATTSEGLGFTGRGEGIACFSSVLISKEE